MSERELLPCPCGCCKPDDGPIVVGLIERCRKVYRVAVPCGILGPDAPTEGEAAAAWNECMSRRAPDPVREALEAVAEAAREALEPWNGEMDAFHRIESALSALDAARRDQ